MKPKRTKQLIAEAGLSQRGAAKALEINERTMRRYCSPVDNQNAPRVVELALMYLGNSSDA
jgi:hypothetical protein